MRTVHFFLAGFAVVALMVVAQEPLRGPDGGTSVHISGIVVLPIPEKPFSGMDTIVVTYMLQDGNTMSRRVDAKVARDSQGRVYREDHNFVPANSHDLSPLYEIHLYDPVAKAQLFCYARSYRCDLTDYKPQASFEPTPEGSYDHGTRTLTREQLGSDVIEGINVIGTRETMTVGAGAVGNDRPIVSTREYWYSDALQTNLAVTRTDAAGGKQVIHLHDISRTEPDPHLWDIPAGFKVRDLRTSARRAR